MTLPILETPTYELILPSTDEKIIFRPFLVKEYKVLLTTLESYPNLEIEIQGHICCTNDGKDGYDNSTGTPNLSVNRAKAVFDYLVERGIDAQRLTYKGFGSSNKLVREFTEEDRITNRRVEIKILNK
jgi:outer membrane protein OmpA-like peptidoglycan-associated protein